MDTEQIHSSRARFPHIHQTHISKSLIKGNLWYDIIWEVRPNQAQIEEWRQRTRRHKSRTNTKSLRRYRRRDINGSEEHPRLLKLRRHESRHHDSNFRGREKAAWETKENTILNFQSTPQAAYTTPQNRCNEIRTQKPHRSRVVLRLNGYQL